MCFWVSAGASPARTPGEWTSPTVEAAGGIGFLSEALTDRFFTNPDSLARGKGTFEMEFVDLSLIASRDFLQEAHALVLLGRTQGFNQQGVSSFPSELQNLWGLRLAGGQFMSLGGVRFGRVAVIPYFTSWLQTDLNVAPWTQTALTAEASLGLGLGAGAEAWGFSFGIAARPLVRAYAGGEVAVGDLGQTTDPAWASAPQEGTGVYVPVDISLARPLLPWLALHASAKDCGGAPPVTTLSGVPPPVYPMRLAVGLKAAMAPWPLHRLALATELEDIQHLGEAGDRRERWRLGAQYAYRLPSSMASSSLGIFVGLRGEQPGFGILADLFFVKLSAGLWTEPAASASARPMVGARLLSSVNL